MLRRRRSRQGKEEALSLERLQDAQASRKDETISPDMPRLSKINVPSPTKKAQKFALPQDDGSDRLKELGIRSRKLGIEIEA